MLAIKASPYFRINAETMSCHFYRAQLLVGTRLLMPVASISRLRARAEICHILHVESWHEHKAITPPAAQAH